VKERFGPSQVLCLHRTTQTQKNADIHMRPDWVSNSQSQKWGCRRQHTLWAACWVWLRDYKDSTVRLGTSSSLSIPIRNPCIMLTPDCQNFDLCTPLGWLHADKGRPLFVGVRATASMNTNTRRRGLRVLSILIQIACCVTLYTGGRHSSVDTVPRLESKRPQFDSRRG